MEEALRVYSWRGVLCESIKATEIRSRADARKLGPFADCNKRPVTWVNWEKDLNKEGRRRRRAHFRLYPRISEGARPSRKDIAAEIELRNSAKSESTKHQKAKECVANYLKKLVSNKKRAHWSFIDARISQFPLSGNLLSEVEDVSTEYPIITPFGKNYRLDIALLGRKILTKPLILGAIELEFNHEFEMLKCLICKSSGFPLLSLDLTETNEKDIDDKWCHSKLLETTAKSEDAKRRNYLYIHNMLYPVYMDIPENVNKDRRHQYVIFVRDEDYDQLLKLLNLLKDSLGIDGDQVLVQPVQCKNSQMLRMLENEGSIAGHDWRAYNEKRYIRVTLNRPISKSGPIYKYHLAMAGLVNAHFETLVGYKYRPGLRNDEPDNPLWNVWVKATEEEKIFSKTPLLPKHVSEPVGSIIAVLDEMKMISR